MTYPLARFTSLVLLLTLAACTRPAEEPAATADTTTVAGPSYLASGEALFTTHCASCHGADGRGGGPVAALLTVPPADLTAIRARRGGAFPEDELYQIIDGRADVQAHGTREMPVWGNTWSEADGVPQPPEAVEHRINLLIEYLRTLQAEPAA